MRLTRLISRGGGITHISPSPAFREACRRVLGADDPGTVIPALRNPELLDLIRTVHWDILQEAERKAAQGASW
jgi:hypothetical protein